MKRVLVLCLLTLAGCNDMRQQPRYDAYGRARLFANGEVEQAPPPGVVAQEDAALQRAATTRPPMSLALLMRGRERYGIDCVQCHDPAGYGEGVVPARGFPRPPSFHSPQLKAMTSRQIVDVITNGYGAMYPHADRVAPADRWAIAAYVQALQLSQATPASALSAADLAHIAETGHGR
jgi:mono/diheme cytochrome c family protein